MGVAAIASVGSIRSAIEEGLTREASTLLGGDAEAQFTYRFATEAERAWLRETGEITSEVVDFRSMLVSGEERVLVQVKGVDGIYPIYGTLALSPAIPPDEALAGGGLVAEQVLIDRLGLALGDQVKLGNATFTLRAAIENEPDRMGGGLGFGPRVIVATEALAGSGLLAEGTLFNSMYRLKLPEETNLNALKSDALSRFEETGLRWRDRRNGTAGIGTFVDRLGAFLVLVGLAGLTVGGVGVSASVRAYLERKNRHHRHAQNPWRNRPHDICDLSDPDRDPGPRSASPSGSRSGQACPRCSAPCSQTGCPCPPFSTSTQPPWPKPQFTAFSPP